MNKSYQNSIKFVKMEGTGNDFIIIEEKLNVKKIQKLTPFLCNRKKGIGADGILIPLNNRKYDFKMIYFNSDGSRAEFCANGARCLVYYMFLKNRKKRFKFIADDGIHEGEVIDEKNKLIKIKLKNPEFKGEFLIKEFKNEKFFLINSGVPHLIQETSNLLKINVKEKGKFLRFHPFFKPHGTNVDFIKIKGNKIFIRTYERGVEDEVSSCGTGAVASAFFAKMKSNLNEFEIYTKEGEVLKVEFNKKGTFLTGQVRIVFKGKIELSYFPIR